MMVLIAGKKDATDATSAALEVLPESFRSFAKITLEMCAYAGSGDVLVIQELLHTCSESQSYAVCKLLFFLRDSLKRRRSHMLSLIHISEPTRPY